MGVLRGRQSYSPPWPSTAWGGGKSNALVPTTALFFRVTSMRLAYQELQLDRKKEEKKLQNLEGKKREQAERLGMGLVSRRYLAVGCKGQAGGKVQTGALEAPHSEKVS